jgi:integrase
LRHASITDTQRKSKGDRMAAKAHAGHKNITTTDRYTHSNLDDSRRALKARFGEYGTPTGTREKK